MADSIPDEVRNWFGGHLLENLPASTIVVSRDFEVVMANRAFRDVFGEATGRHCYEVYKKRDSHCDRCPASQTFQDGQTRVHNESGIDRHGHIAHFVVHTVPVVGDDGVVSHVIEMSLDITEARRVQRQLDVLFEQVPCRVSMLDRDLRIVRANGTARHASSNGEGVHCYELYKNRAVPCPDCPALQTLADGLPHSSRQSGLNGKGQPASYFVSTAPVSSFGAEVEHVIEMSVDISEADKLERELIREGEFRRNLTESALDALVAADAKGRVTIYNPAAQQLFGDSPEGVLGSSRVWDRLPAAFLELFANGGDGVVLRDVAVRHESGELIPVRFSGAVLREAGEVIGGAAFLHDLRDIKQIEQEKLENERLAAVGETVAQLAHGIKNVLTGLQGGMYALRTGMRQGRTDRVERGWRALDRNLERITEMVKGFLSLSRGHAVEASSAEPAAVAREVHQLYHDTAAQSGIDLRLEAAEGMAPARMDREGMHTCLSNLVSNAMDACLVADGEEHCIVMRVREEDGDILYEVTDDGCGMDVQIKRKVFTTFFTTKGLGGTGLGLLVTRKMVQEHGGRISVESDPGRGSTFSIRLPRARLAALPGPARPSMDSKGEAREQQATQ